MLQLAAEYVGCSQWILTSPLAANIDIFACIDVQDIDKNRHFVEYNWVDI